MSRRDRLIFECRYYNGESDNPFVQKLSSYEVDKSLLPPPDCIKTEYNLSPDEVDYLESAATSWKYECFWVENYVKENTKHLFEANQYYVNDLIDFEPNDGTPIELKALLWNRYEHWTSGRLEDFKQWYLKYYQPRPTNRQRRAEERKKTLLPMCRYYKGEQEQPSQMNQNESLFWFYEKKWVDDLSYSYRRGDEWRKTYEDKHLEDFAKKYNIPATLIGMLFNRFMHWSSGYETTVDFYKWMEKYYICK